MKLDNLYVSELEFEDSGMRGPKGDSGDAPSLSISKVAQYLYKADLKNYKYEDGELFVRIHYPDATQTSCASAAKDNLLGHNYDGPYDNTAEFVVRTPARHGVRSVVGVAAIPGVLTNEMVDAETESELTKSAYNVLPLFLVDGINDKGVAVSIHSMPDTDAGRPSDDSGICALFAVRYVLDHAVSAENAVELISEQTFWLPDNSKIKAGFYLLISDKNHTFKVDLSGNYEEFEAESHKILTNFRAIGWDGDPTTLEPHANGIERYHILDDAYDQIENEANMLAALKNVRYTGIYDTAMEDFWYSDYNGVWHLPEDADLTINSPHNAYAGVVAMSANEFENRERNGHTSQTIHTVVYNMEELTMSVMVQEEDRVYRFCLSETDLLYNEIDRAKTAEEQMRRDFADTFYTKSEVDGALSDLRDDILDNVGENYYNKTEADELLSGLHQQIGEETDDKLDDKADAFENEGSAGQVLYRTATGAAWQSLPTQLPDVTIDDENKVLTVENGVWTASDKFADYFRYVNITVSIVSDNGGVPVDVLNVTIKNSDTGDVINEALYRGQPVTFRVPKGLGYRIEQSGTWEGYHNPTPAAIEGAANNDTTVVFTYEAIQVPETLRELQIIVDGGSASSMRNHIGLQFEDTYTELGEIYPIIWDLKDVVTVEDENGDTHAGVVLEWHYATPTPMPFDAPERLEVDLATEPTAQAGMYYYGLSSGTYRLLNVNAGDPLPTTYDALFKNAVRNPDGNIIRRGYASYAESAVRKWLNSDQPAGSWWSATHVGDMPPEAASQLPGFMSGCSSQILSMAKPAKIRCAAADDVVQTVYDRFFIPSVNEMNGISSYTAEGEPWQDWVEATGLGDPDNGANTGRRIFGISSTTASSYVGLRTVNTAYQYVVWDVKANGSLDGYSNANVMRQFTPCCVVY